MSNRRPAGALEQDAERLRSLASEQEAWPARTRD
jgi:hypothetical protein